MTELIRKYLDEGKDVNSQSLGSSTALNQATRDGALSVVTQLIEMGADVNITDRNGNHALHIAIKNGKLQIVKYLCETNKYDLNEQDSAGNNILHLAAIGGNQAIIEYLINKIDINSTNNNQQTAMHLAADYRKWEVVSMLLKNNADPQISDKEGLTLLHLCAKGGHLNIIKILIEQYNIDINQTDNDGHGLLFWACNERHWEIVEWAINNGTENPLDATEAILDAAHSSKWEIIKLLSFAKDIEINYSYNNGQTILHMLTHNTQWDLAKHLINHNNPDIDATNMHGKTILDYTIEHKNDEMVKFLLSKGAYITDHARKNYPQIDAIEKEILLQNQPSEKTIPEIFINIEKDDISDFIVKDNAELDETLEALGNIQL